MADKMIKHRSDTIKTRWRFKEEDDTVIDPDTRTYHAIEPDGTEHVISSDTKESTGVYTVEYQIPSDAAYGDWKIRCKGEKGTYVETEIILFTVEAI